MLKSSEIKKLLKEEKFTEAQEMAVKILEKMVKENSKAQVAAIQSGEASK